MSSAFNLVSAAFCRQSLIVPSSGTAVFTGQAISAHLECTCVQMRPEETSVCLFGIGSWTWHTQFTKVAWLLFIKQINYLQVVLCVVVSVQCNALPAVPAVFSVEDTKNEFCCLDWPIHFVSDENNVEKEKASVWWSSRQIKANINFDDSNWEKISSILKVLYRWHWSEWREKVWFQLIKQSELGAFVFNLNTEAIWWWWSSRSNWFWAHFSWEYHLLF